MRMIEIKPVSDSSKYDVAYYQNGTSYHTVCSSEDAIINSVKKYLNMREQYMQNFQGRAVTGNELLNANKIRAQKGIADG